MRKRTKGTKQNTKKQETEDLTKKEVKIFLINLFIFIIQLSFDIFF